MHREHWRKQYCQKKWPGISRDKSVELNTRLSLPLTLHFHVTWALVEPVSALLLATEHLHSGRKCQLRECVARETCRKRTHAWRGKLMLSERGTGRDGAQGMVPTFPCPCCLTSVEMGLHVFCLTWGFQSQALLWLYCIARYLVLFLAFQTKAWFSEVFNIPSLTWQRQELISGVWVQLGSYNRHAVNWWLINSKHGFLTVREAG